MLHIRFMSDEKTICEKPSGLGNDLVIIDYDPEDTVSCTDCSDLLAAHNMRDYRRESFSSIRTLPKQEKPRDMTAVQGFLIGVGVTSAFWLTFSYRFLSN